MCLGSTRRIFADAVSFAVCSVVVSPARRPHDQAEQHGQRLVVAEHERRQAVPGGEPVPAVAAAHRFHGHIQVDQLVHIPPHGAPLDAEPVG